MQPTHSLHMGPIKQASRRDLGGQIVVTIPLHDTFVTFTLYKVVQESKYFLLFNPLERSGYYMYHLL
jgi:hypothetical protein